MELGMSRAHPRARQLGRTYELPMFLALLGISLAVFVPACQDFLVRKRVASGLELAAAAQRVVQETFARTGPGDMSRLAGRLPPPTQDVGSLAIARGGTVTVSYTARVVPPGENELQLVPVAAGKAIDLGDPANRDRGFEWECAGGAGRTTVPRKFLPSSCRPPAGPMSLTDWILAVALGTLAVALVGGWVLAVGSFVATQTWALLKRREKWVDLALNTFGFALMAALIVGTFAYAAGFDLLGWLQTP